MSNRFEPERIEKGMLNSTVRDGDPQPRARHARPGLEGRIREEKDGHCTLYAIAGAEAPPGPDLLVQSGLRQLAGSARFHALPVLCSNPRVRGNHRAFAAHGASRRMRGGLILV